MLLHICVDFYTSDQEDSSEGEGEGDGDRSGTEAAMPGAKRQREDPTMENRGREERGRQEGGDERSGQEEGDG